MTNLIKFLRWATVLGLWFIAACTTVPDGSVELHEVARAVPGGDPPWQRGDDAEGVRLRRGGSDLPMRLGMTLQTGDVLATGPGVAAVLRIGGRGTVALDENSEVRIGSLEVIFGRLFADLRGLFTVRSQTVEAVNEGTRYLFEVGRNRNVRVVVAEGTVNCVSPRGDWPSVRLSAGRSLVYSGQGTPRVQPADAREVEGPLRAITSAPRAGWCCSAPGSDVSRGYENRCAGRFSVSRESAEAMCRPAPAAVHTGWCCVPQQRRLFETTAERCTAAKGAFYDSEGAAKQRCAYGN